MKIIIRKFYQNVVVVLMDKYNNILNINNDKKNNINNKNNNIDSINMNNMIKNKTKIPSPTKHKPLSSSPKKHNNR